MKLWHAWTCPYCMRVRIALEEKGLAWSEQVVDLANKPPELLALNPGGGVPVLVTDDGDAVPESLAILEYLDARYPDTAPLLPNQPDVRARARQAYDRAASLLQPHLPKVLRGSPDEQAAAAGQVKAALATLEATTPETGFLFGELSIADLALASFVMKLPAPLRPTALGLPRLGRWEAAMLARKSVATHTAPRPPASAS